MESFVLLNGVGGDCLDDFEHLRADGGLAELLGHTIPAPEAERNFLYEIGFIDLTMAYWLCFGL